MANLSVIPCLLPCSVKVDIAVPGNIASVANKEYLRTPLGESITPHDANQFSKLSSAPSELLVPIAKSRLTI